MLNKTIIALSVLVHTTISCTGFGVLRTARASRAAFRRRVQPELIGGGRECGGEENEQVREKGSVSKEKHVKSRKNEETTHPAVQARRARSLRV
jgi:hypothetical protein